MRKILINKNWNFKRDYSKINNQIDSTWDQLDLPHTWNGEDGQDGGNDYFRGKSVYMKNIKVSDYDFKKHTYLEFEGVNSSAEVFVNGEFITSHDGGYSTWRANVSKYTKEDFTIEVVVDNAENDRVYPQTADFTFYGGIYRNVSLISVGDLHFDLDYYGTPGVKVTPIVKGENAEVEICVFLSESSKVSNGSIKYSIYDNDTEICNCEKPLSETLVNYTIENVHLWHGLKDPHLYEAKVELLVDKVVVDERSIKFGCRSYEIDPELGFILNGEKYPLRGVSRHQDYPGIGNALTSKEHERDMELIREVGATTIRLAHYQHNQYFYDLCDKYGLVIWAEIPYISKHMDNGFDNTVSQMKELVTQNYNHSSIVVWGLSNEITMGGADDPVLLKNHHTLNDLCHEMDQTRPTTMAVVSPCAIDEDYVHIPDTVSYNHYFGWYGGDVSLNGPWLDKFHEKYPNMPIGLSEYGCEALDWHTSDPEAGDYTEEYQAYYHEEMIKQLFSREYLWATHVWNMFDFAADARSEGGENGMNHKGLVTFDRKYKKDSFYAYKAWLSDEPFVHICSKRYVDRVEDIAKIRVYSNIDEVSLFANGKLVATKSSEDHFFTFEVDNIGETHIEVKADNCSDNSTIRKVDEFNEDYKLKETGDLLNWFEVNMPDGYFSINDKIANIIKSEEGKVFIINLVKELLPEQTAGADEEQTLMMMGNYTVQRFVGLIVPMMKMDYGRDELLELNENLNKIKK